MFTLQQIKAAHAKVKTGADFPRYIQEIKSYGLSRYIFNVTDGAIVYYGGNGHKVAGPPVYTPKIINPSASPDSLRNIIAVHQQGKTDFATFCSQAAGAGVKQWVVDTERMLCIYEDANGNEMVAEPIPEAY
ncbi:phage envelope protein [Mucilaginibacter hurinus]|uniref:Phage envelope protein n=1 Tax=Mucilaginibacter hurinus TaxID=2201324 RepID=A0A367GMD0_9SPHI|nr:DUF1398 family protein [Mucilaginibacter hurinus]RCH53841.1 phage envelope protein [Mucilaginibacter hurinus]